MLNTLRDTANQIESLLTDVVAKVAPWAASIPTAYLVGRATTATALELGEYNQAKRKPDPRAPFTLAAVLVAVYLVVAVGLTVALDIVPSLALYSPAIFPLLSLCGVTVLAIRGDHKRRVGAIETVKRERKEKRQSRRQAVVVRTSENVSNNGKPYANLDTLQAGRMSKRDARLDTLLTFYLDNPGDGPSDAARAVGVSRQTIYAYNSELEGAGKVRKNGQGWEVLC